MLEPIYDINGAYELFKSYNGLGNENCIFYATYEKALTAKDVAKAAVLTGVVGALGGSVSSRIGVQLGNNNFYPGYLINVTEYGVGLIALEYDGFTTQDAINKMKLFQILIVLLLKMILKLCVQVKILYVWILQ